MRGVIYTRTSQDEINNPRASNKTQEAYCREEAQKRGDEIVQCYSDIGKSGGSFKRRKELKRLREDAKNKKFEVIYILEFSRLSRKLLDQELFIEEMKDLKIKIISCDGTEETEIRQIRGVINEASRSFFKKRTEIEHQSRLKNNSGIHLSRPPLGYKMEMKIVNGVPKSTGKWLINKKNASKIKQIFNLRLEGKSLKEIEQIFKISIPSIKYILSNISYCGFVKYRDQLILAHEPIISKEVYENVRRI